MAIDLKSPPKEMETNAALAANFLKTMAHEGRLMILCHLGIGRKIRKRIGRHPKLSPSCGKPDVGPPARRWHG
jgi:hypothetical protein